VVGVVAVVVSSAIANPVAAAGQPADPPPTTPAVIPPRPEPPALDPSPHIRVLLARIEVIGARTTVAERQRAAAATRADEAGAQAVFDRAEAAQTDAERELGTAGDQLDSSAAFAYRHASGGDLLPVLEDDFNGRAQERQLFVATIDHHQQQVVAAEAAVADAGAEVDAARETLAVAQQSTADQDDLVAASRRVLADAAEALRTAAADERRPTTFTSWQLSLEGPSVFTAGELAQWYGEQGQGWRASVPVAALARAYIDEGAAEGIRGDMAFAQSIHETGWFANTDTIIANNFAGIGHCSACAGGFWFATAPLGVLAQIQLLKSYAQVDPVYNRPRADPDLNGPAGCCETWNDLAGVWASDPDYGPSILGYYADMLEWLVAQRTAGT